MSNNLTVFYWWTDDNDACTLAIYLNGKKTDHTSFGYGPLNIFQFLEAIVSEVGAISELKVYEINDNIAGQFDKWIYANHEGEYPANLSDIPEEFLITPPKYRNASIFNPFSFE